MNRLKRGYAVRSIDAITHPDQLSLRQADLTNAIGRAGPDGHHHPSSPGAPLQSAEPHSMIHSWRVLCLPWLHPGQCPRTSGRGLRRSLLEPPAQLRPRTVTASQDGDADGNVTAVA